MTVCSSTSRSDEFRSTAACSSSSEPPAPGAYHGARNCAYSADPVSRCRTSTLVLSITGIGRGSTTYIAGSRARPSRRSRASRWPPSPTWSALSTTRPESAVLALLVCRKVTGCPVSKPCAR